MTGLRTLLTSRLYTVRGDSMKPSFQPGELLAVGASAHSSSAPARGEIVVVVDPTDGEKQYLKRVVGMPGEEIALADGLLSVNGRRLVEPYLGGLPSSPGWARASGGLAARSTSSWGTVGLGARTAGCSARLPWST